jgi:TraY domain
VGAFKLMERTPGRRGPKPRGPFIDQRITLTSRVTEGMRRRLEEASATSGRSLAQEIELRLEKSFGDEQRLKEALELAFGPQIAGFALATAFVARQAADASLMVSGTPLTVNGPWLSNAFAFSQVAAAVHDLIKGIEPDGEPVEPALLQTMPSEVREVMKNAGRAAAAAVCRAIAYPQPGGPLGPWARVIHEWLGEDAIARIKEALGAAEQQ